MQYGIILVCIKMRQSKDGKTAILKEKTESNEI